MTGLTDQSGVVLLSAEIIAEQEATASREQD